MLSVNVRTLLAVTLSLVLAGCATGRLDLLGEFQVTGQCEFELTFEIIQNGRVVASVELDDEFSEDLDDDDVNYRMPLRLHILVTESNAFCPKSLQQGAEYWWPSQNTSGTLARQKNGKYRVDLKQFEAQVTPGEKAVR
jgi:hypothetical protein